MEEIHIAHNDVYRLLFKLPRVFVSGNWNHTVTIIACKFLFLSILSLLLNAAVWAIPYFHHFHFVSGS